MNKYQSLGNDTRKMEGVDIEWIGGGGKERKKENKVLESPEELRKNDLTLNFSLFLPEGKEVLEVQKELETIIDFLKVTLELDSLPLTKDFLQIQETGDNTLNFSFIIPDFELEEDELEKEEIIDFLDNLLHQIKRNSALQAFFIGGAVGEDLGILSSDIIYKAKCSDVCETVKAYVTGRENLEGFAKNYLEIVNFLEKFILDEKQTEFPKLQKEYMDFLYQNNEEIFRAFNQWQLLDPMHMDMETIKKERLAEFREEKTLDTFHNYAITQQEGVFKRNEQIKIQKLIAEEVKNLIKKIKKEAIMKVANETLSWMYMLEQDHQIRLTDFKGKLKKENQEMSDVDLSEISTKEAVNDVLLGEEALKNQTYGRRMLYKLSRGGLNLYTKTFLHLHGGYLHAERKKIESQVKDMAFHIDNENLDITGVFDIFLESARKVEQDLSNSHFVGRVYSQGLKLFPKSIVKRVDFLLSTKKALENQGQQLKKAKERREKLFENSQKFDMISALSRGVSPDIYKKAFEAPIKK